MSDNRYADILNSSPDDEGRKLARAKRRKRSRILAFLTLFVIIAVLAGGAVFGIGMLVKNIQKKPVQTASVSEETTEPQSEIQEILNEISDTVEEPVEEVTEPDNSEEDEAYDEWISGKIATLSLEDKVMGLFVVSPEQITGVDKVIQAGDGTKAALEKYHVGGIVYSDKNITSGDQFKEMLDKTKEFVSYETFLIMKEETGNTVLASKLGLEETMTAEEIGSSLDPFNSYSENLKIAQNLKGYGINFNIGIVGDILYRENEEETDPLFMAENAYGTDVNLVSKMTQEAINAHKESGVASCMGYFPGQGSLVKNPADSMTSTSVTLETLTQTQLPIYESAVASGLDAIIVSHEYADNLTSSNLPCSLSKEIYTDILRESLGFKNTILMTDALNTTSIADYYTSSEACVKALKAGADMVMCPENIDEAIEGVLEAVKSGVISEDRINDSLKRIWRVKYRPAYESERNPEESLVEDD